MSKFWMSEIYGGYDANQAVGNIGLALKKALTQLEANTYSSLLKEFGIKLFVSGKISHSKEKSGFSSIRIYKDKGMVTFNIVMNQDIWQEGPVAIREFFHQTLIGALEAIGEKAKKQRIPLSGDKLLGDVERVLRMI